MARASRRRPEIAVAAAGSAPARGRRVVDGVTHPPLAQAKTDGHREDGQVERAGDSIQWQLAIDIPPRQHVAATFAELARAI